MLDLGPLTRYFDERFFSSASSCLILVFLSFSLSLASIDLIVDCLARLTFDDHHQLLYDRICSCVRVFLSTSNLGRCVVAHHRRSICDPLGFRLRVAAGGTDVIRRAPNNKNEF